MSRAFNRGTGLLVINVVNSNPNGDPDTESEPRTFDDGRGLISPVSFKRKIRDLMRNPNDQLIDEHEDNSEEGPVRIAALAQVVSDMRKYDILETRYRKREGIKALKAAEFVEKYWDARLFGNTFLEAVREGEDTKNEEDTKKRKKGEKPKADNSHFITTGVVQFGPGVSLAPVDIQRLTLTNKSGVQGGKDRGMAPLAFRVVRHGLYVMPFFVNSSAAAKSGCDATDVELLKFLIPYAYAHTASAIRPQVDVIHAWYAEHKNPLGSCPDPLILGALTPRKRADPDQASISLADYDVPTDLPADLKQRLASFEDLCVKEWSAWQAA